MFDFGKKKPVGETIQFKIDGMHCVSCSMNIDGELEETPGVLSATTNYAKAMSTITFDPQHITPEELEQKIVDTGYSVTGKV